MKKFLWVIIVLCLIAGAWYFGSRSPSSSVQSVNGTATSDNIELKKITSTEFAQKVSEGQSVILDIRTPSEFASGHIAKAKDIDFYATDFSTKLQELDKNVTYLIYCHSGNRSAKALETMRSLGFKSVYELEKGINNWNTDNRLICTNC
jgi:rhodanese-related sulfurtransferase